LVGATADAAGQHLLLGGDVEQRVLHLQATAAGTMLPTITYWAPSAFQSRKMTSLAWAGWLIMFCAESASSSRSCAGRCR
jgi:hypothetical protein